MGHRIYTEHEHYTYLDGTRIKEVVDLEGKLSPVMEGFRPTEWQVAKLVDGRVVLVVKSDLGERRVESLGKSFRICEVHGIDITEQLPRLWPVLNRWATER